MMAKRFYIIAGEASGDLHGGNLVRELFKAWAGAEQGEELQVRAWGGDRMAAAGAEVVKHYRELAFMGFTQVIMNLRTILRNIDTCKADIEAFKPDALDPDRLPGLQPAHRGMGPRQAASRCITTSVRRYGPGRRDGYTPSRRWWTGCM